MVTVRVTETYDMKTTVGKLGIIGIHTPRGAQIGRLYPGLCKNYKYIRFKKCDVVGACASVLPADPLQVGVENGTVAPEDMFNPILYKAVSNSSFDNLVSRIYDTINTTDVIEKTGSVNEQNLSVSEANAFKIYYALLADNNGRFKKAMPQSGFRMRGLYPIAHTLISQYGNIKKPTVGVVDSLDGATEALTGVNENLSEVPVDNITLSGMMENKIITPQVFRGRSVRMPRMPLHYEIEGGSPDYNQAGNALPKTFVGCLVLPPARLHEFYYRMRVTWTVSFEGLISMNSIGNATYLVANGEASYGTDYSFESSKSDLPISNDTVDTDGVDCNKIMES